MPGFRKPHTFLIPVLLCAAAPSWAATPLDFNRDIQPILSENCYHCHGPDKAERKGGLRLDEEAAAKALVDGHIAIRPGDSSQSTAIQRIFSTDPEEVMPTPKSNRKLTAAQKEMLKRWVEEGAPWGKHWAFVKPVKAAVPALPANISDGNTIDAFVLDRLSRENVAPSTLAPKETLIRRVTLDLTGLPPTTEEVSAFLADTSPQAYERVVDRLLKSPRFGERMTWDWLDAARYADSNGYQGDPERTMWPWRDWVVQAFNSNMPYDQFTLWQMAGDLLPEATPVQKLATGFHRNHMMNGEGGRIPEEARVENVMDRVDTTATVWLGLTLACAKCHDHKFDPLTQREYYALYDFFNQTSEDGAIRGGKAAPAMDMSTPAELERVKKAEARVATVAADVEAYELKKFPRAEGVPLIESDAAKLPGNLPATLAKVLPVKRNVDGLLEAVAHFKNEGTDPEYVKVLEKLLSANRERTAAANGVTKVMIMDTLPQPRETSMLAKGAYDKPTDKVQAGTPAILPALLTPSGSPRPTRLDLGRWLVSPEHPLTSRVTVNRLWQGLFGMGLVKSTEDFGVQGAKPSHPELLDWLAVDFIESGWDVKALCKQIVMSRTYRQSSRVTPELLERDPENRLLARGARHRLPSWMMRDQALFAAGLLNEAQGGPPVRPYQPEGIWEEATFGKISYKQDHGDALYRRSLYIFWRRIVGPTMFFDNAARQTCDVRSLRTNTPLHALTTLNDITYVEAARAMAQRVLLTSSLPDDRTKIDQAFRLVTCRVPSAEERDIILSRLDYLRTQYQETPAEAVRLLAVGESPRDKSLPEAEHAAWTALCQLLLNLDEAITRE
ncbi:PSD1 and planctomycete cytochrome C domain-containing protein [Verrucomicrobium sp. BvORR106]|uniref:PSD1 and planctomycete cytochrome C domain-containing protein n=1 Tax=Verrucomicrobium sp. BvORR106 TaxID=1403819 RepID=UPI00068EC00D|nr:PSD1 and planctomycete cytochrome C domain-containing protein [Verrucomicrobium sp. BvORR106]